MPNGTLGLALWSGFNFTGRRIVFRRGGVAVRDLRAFRFNDMLSSFQVVNPNRNVTLVLFMHANFQGPFRVFRGSRNVADLRNFNFNDVTSSFVLVDRNLSDAEIERIQRTATPPGNILVIRP